MSEFENKFYKGIYYSRFIASWTNEGGKTNWEFKAWLKHLKINNEYIPDDIIQEIYNLGTNGKMELEQDAKEFMKK